VVASGGKWREVAGSGGKWREVGSMHMHMHPSTHYTPTPLQLVASFPLPVVRASFFTTLLACMLSELDEFMLMRFILLLKGSQAATRVGSCC
jgi:hypothetical protein